jgi:hypothetical protein
MERREREKIEGGERFGVEYTGMEGGNKDGGGIGKRTNSQPEERERRVRVRGQSLLSIEEETEGERRDKG